MNKIDLIVWLFSFMVRRLQAASLNYAAKANQKAKVVAEMQQEIVNLTAEHVRAERIANKITDIIK